MVRPLCSPDGCEVMFPETTHASSRFTASFQFGTLSQQMKSALWSYFFSVFFGTRSVPDWVKSGNLLFLKKRK